jgi:hypothetical protein
VQRDFDAYARVFELIFQTITIDLHLAQSHHGFIVKPVILRLDLAAVFDSLILRLDSGGLKQQDRTAAQNKQDILHFASPNARYIAGAEVRNWGEPLRKAHWQHSEPGDVVSTNLFFVLSAWYFVAASH